MVANTPTQDLSGLQQRALALETHAEARTQAYQRATWIRFVGVFFLIPFVVVLLRLEMAAWTLLRLGRVDHTGWRSAVRDRYRRLDQGG